MKTKIIAAIIVGIVISGGVAFVYAQMSDCMYPPSWWKFPRHSRPLAQLEGFLTVF